MFDPDYLSPDFSARCSGYLRTHARDLGAMLAKLPEGCSVRERAIAMAIGHGVRFPDRWEKNRAPLKLKRSPAEALGVGGPI